MLEITINDQNYVVADALVDAVIAKLSNQFLDIYKNKIDEKIRLASKVYARNKIYELEKKTGDTSLRPPKGTDPVIHYVNMLIETGKKGIKDGYITLRADEESQSTVFTSVYIGFKGEGQAGG